MFSAETDAVRELEASAVQGTLGATGWPWNQDPGVHIQPP